MTLGENMHSIKISEYFIKDYFLFTKSYQKENLLSEFCSKVPKILNYKFVQDELLFQAFTHKSFAHEVKVELDDNEKLEFLGDSVLQITVSEMLYKKFQHLDEGHLSKLRSSIVNEEVLAQVARFYQLGDYILLGKGELKSNGHDKDSILSDTLEALFGAIYLDSDFETTKSIILGAFSLFEKNIRPIFDENIILDFDAKSRLQEVVMSKFKTTPRYLSKELPGNKFEINLMVKDKIIGSIKHHSKKRAMQLLAKEALDKNTLLNL